MIGRDTLLIALGLVAVGIALIFFFWYVPAWLRAIYSVGLP